MQLTRLCNKLMCDKPKYFLGNSWAMVWDMQSLCDKTSYMIIWYAIAPMNSRLSVVVRSPAPFRLSQNGCWPSQRSQLTQALPSIFLLCCPLNDCRKAAHSFFKIGLLFSLFLFLFFCPSLALLCLLLLLMSSNVHPNPGPIFSCSVCTGNVTQRGKSEQCCACSKWVHLRCSQLSLSKFRALGSSHSWSCSLSMTL